jgi:two-component system, LytTR family, sensor kinase
MSMIFNLHRIKKISILFINRLVKIYGTEKIEAYLCTASIISLMIMSFLNMVGFGNPSNDSLLTDFAFAHSLIIITIILLGKLSAIIWFAVTLSTLLYVSLSRGMDYKYHFLTPNEARIYEKKLEQKDPKALLRQAELKEEGLNPPNVSRYFNVWLVMIVQAVIVAYFFNGISRNMLKVIPEVEVDIDRAIEDQYEIVRLNTLLLEEKTKGELHFLKAQMNPHLLYNTLAHFHAKAENLDENLASSILKLTEIMRYSLIDATDDKVFLEDEIDQIENLIDLHQLRYSHKLFIELNVDLQISNVKIYPLLLLSFVENALKHGQLQNRNAPLKISIQTNQDALIFQTENNKNSAAKVISTNIGLSNIQKRLEILYPENHVLAVDNQEDKYSCCLTLTLNSDESKNNLHYS